MSIGVDDYEFVRELIRARSAIALGGGKKYLVEARLSSLARKEGLPSATELIHELRTRRTADLETKVVEAMTTHETAFFRDRPLYEALRTQVLPDLVARRAQVRRLRLWCAASSTGQEPYSLALMIREHFPAVARWDLLLLASDISSAVLARAREGRYRALEVNRGLDAPFLGKYFDKEAADWKIRDEIRKMVEFREINLASPWPSLPSMDIVFMRNVLIYFDVGTKRDILLRVRDLLEPDGYLFLGGAETTLYVDDSFERVQFDRTAGYRLRERETAGARHD